MTPWTHVNHRLIAKAIGELHFEEVLAPRRLAGPTYELALASGVTYRFDARPGQWGHLWVEATSLERERDGVRDQALEAAQFFIDALAETQMGELTLGPFLEELNHTLHSDLELLRAPASSATHLATLNGEELQVRLEGHPKLLLNKGRGGWGARDLEAFSPETAAPFQLRWLLARTDRLVVAEADWDHTAMLEQSFQGEERRRFEELLAPYDLSTYALVPVHPWQWDRVIVRQYQSELQRGHLVDLGPGGDRYRPQVSLRTLSNVDRPRNHDLKLPLSILNTSCVRGLPHRHLQITPALSRSLRRLCEEDQLLRRWGTAVLVEAQGLGLPHPHFKQVPGAPYRYHEQLGAVWRESVQGHLEAGERGIIAAALLHRDPQGQTLLEAYADRAGVSVEEWLRCYTRHVVVPLYHLQLRYGIGLVAHGQNIVVRLSGDLPSGLFLKDFHGDLRLASSHHTWQREFLGPLRDRLTELPPEHLIHDLVTGHFITVLRFLAGRLEDSGALSEDRFYAVVASELRAYVRSLEAPVPEALDLLAPTFQRVLVNAVRFKVGYGDSAERPLPLLGSLIPNPLHRRGLP